MLILPCSSLAAGIELYDYLDIRNPLSHLSTHAEFLANRIQAGNFEPAGVCSDIGELYALSKVGAELIQSKITIRKWSFGDQAVFQLQNAVAVLGGESRYLRSSCETDSPTPVRNDLIPRLKKSVSILKNEAARIDESLNLIMSRFMKRK